MVVGNMREFGIQQKRFLKRYDPVSGLGIDQYGSSCPKKYVMLKDMRLRTNLILCTKLHVRKVLQDYRIVHSL